LAAEQNREIHIISDDEILLGFENQEIVVKPWQIALRMVGVEYGLTDETGRPVNAWARGILASGKKIHRRARREELKYRRREKEVEQ
jgi:hypothetical protein